MLKRMINLGGSLLVFAADRIGAGAAFLVGRPWKQGIVLAYHAVLPAERAQFARQMDVLKRHAKTIPADVRELPDEPGLYAAVTFDDGLQSVVDNGLPELKKREIPSTLFIVTDVLGGYPRWEYMGGDDPSKEKAMTEQQLRELPSDLVAIGSHSMTHPLLTHMDEQQLSREILGSRLKLEKIIGKEVKTLSFPYGDFNERVVEQCRASSYERVFSALPVFAFSESGEYLTGRVGVNPSDWPIEFRLKIAGAYRWLPYAFALKRKIFSALQGPNRQNAGLNPGEKAA